MNREEFLQRRKQGIGGSDAAAILGVSKWRTPYQVFLEKTGQMPDIPETNIEAKTWGTMLEHVIGQYFADDAQKTIQTTDEMFFHKDYNFLIGNVDFLIPSENSFLECKTVSQYKADDWADAVPVDYMLQCQHYLNVLGMDHCYIAALIGGNQFKWYPIARNQELIDTMTQRLSDFWINNVKAGIAPEVSLGDNEILDAFFREYKDEDIFLSREDELMAERYMELSILKRQVECEQEEIKTKIKSSLLDSSGKADLNPSGKSMITGVGERVKIAWSRFDANRIDSDLLKKECPEIAEKYSKTTQSGQFRVSIQKGK